MMREAFLYVTALVLLPTCGPGLGTGVSTCADDDPHGIGEPCRKGHTCECTGRCLSAEDAICYPIIEPEKTCISNADCYTALDELAICQTREAACPGGSKRVCVHGCAGDYNCPETMMCLTLNSHQCVPRLCEESCPEDFECNVEGHCVRHECENDDDCAVAYCVEGNCQAELGVCALS